MGLDEVPHALQLFGRQQAGHGLRRGLLQVREQGFEQAQDQRLAHHRLDRGLLQRGMHLEQPVGQLRVLDQGRGLRWKLVLAGDFLPQTVQQFGREPKGLEGIGAIDLGRSVMHLARGHELNRATRENQRIASVRLALHALRDKANMAVEVVVRLELVVRKPGRTQGQAGDMGWMLVLNGFGQGGHGAESGGVWRDVPTPMGESMPPWGARLWLDVGHRGLPRATIIDGW